MKTITYLLFSSLFTELVFTLLSCLSAKVPHSVRKIEIVKTRFVQFQPMEDTFSKPFLAVNEKIWYRDSMAIETVSSFYENIDSKGNITQSGSITHYRFNDIRNKSVYEYKNFSDTARLIRKYLFSDTSVFMTGGWNFKHVRNWGYNGSPEILPDTVIDKIAYKRAKLSRGTSNEPYIMICYFRCDKKGTVFNLDPPISNITGCPVVTYYHYSPLKKGLHLLSEIKFLADTLANEEIKVFNAWEKYAKNNPVNK